MGKDGELAAAILAGGRARRIDGVNKGTLVVGRTAIIDRQLDTLREVAREIFVVGRDDVAWTSRGLRVMPDDIPDAGPLGGIYTAIVRSPCERTLVVACDMPFLSGALLRTARGGEGRRCRHSPPRERVRAAVRDLLARVRRATSAIGLHGE